MTTTTEPTTTPEVPAWRNLDGYYPPELRQRIADARKLPTWSPQAFKAAQG